MKIVHLLTALLLTWIITATAFENQPQTITRTMNFEVFNIQGSEYIEIKVTIPTNVQNLPIKEQNKIILKTMYKAYTKAAGKPFASTKSVRLGGSANIARNKDGSIDPQATALYAFREITPEVCYNWFKNCDWQRFFWF